LGGALTKDDATKLTSNTHGKGGDAGEGGIGGHNDALLEDGPSGATASAGLAGVAKEIVELP